MAEGQREINQKHRAVRQTEQSEQFGEVGVQQPYAFHQRGHLGIRQSSLETYQPVGQASPQPVQRAKSTAQVVEIKARRYHDDEDDHVRRMEQVVHYMGELQMLDGMFQRELHLERRVIREKSHDNDDPKRFAQQRQTAGCGQRLIER